MPDHDPRTIEVTDVGDRSRFELTVDGQLVGFSEYRLRPSRIVFTHTQVDADLRGQGLAGRLTQAALDAARGRGLQVVPLCSYVADFIHQHPGYIDLLGQEQVS